MEISNEIKKFYEKVPVKAFSTISSNGIPNVVAIGSTKIVDNDTVWIIDTLFKKTKENILKTGRVAIAFWEGSEGYQIKGTATYHSEGKIFEEGKDWILKLKPKKIVKGVVKIKVTEIYSITSWPHEEAGKRVA